jgi:hypothetical protein
MESLARTSVCWRLSIGHHNVWGLPCPRLHGTANTRHGGSPIRLAENRVIPEQMAKVAHQIRLEGNLGAHPNRDGLRDVGEDDARAVLGFLDDFIRYVYEILASLARIEEAAFIGDHSAGSG